MSAATADKPAEMVPEANIQIGRDRVGAPMPAPFGDAINLLAPAGVSRRRLDCDTPEDEHSNV